MASKPINIHQAKTHLSRLVERVEAGEEFVIARAGRPAARLVPLEPTRKPIRSGGMQFPGGIPDDFNTMFEKEIETMFYGAPLNVPRKPRKPGRK
jgi:prevent-host-death family protein